MGSPTAMPAPLAIAAASETAAAAAAARRRGGLAAAQQQAEPALGSTPGGAKAAVWR